MASIHSAAKDGKEDVLRQCIDRGTDVNSKDHNGFTPLHHAAANGHVQIIKILLDAEAHIDAQNEQGDTAMHLATKEGQVEALQLLLKRNARKDLENNVGRTPFVCAFECTDGTEADSRAIDVLEMLWDETLNKTELEGAVKLLHERGPRMVELFGKRIVQYVREKEEWDKLYQVDVNDRMRKQSIIYHRMCNRKN